MKKRLISFRLDDRKQKALDLIAEGLSRDRSFVLNEAVDAYLDVHGWQIEHVKQGLKQADAGRFAPDADVAAELRKWRR